MRELRAVETCKISNKLSKLNGSEEPGRSATKAPKRLIVKEVKTYGPRSQKERWNLQQSAEDERERRWRTHPSIQQRIALTDYLQGLPWSMWGTVTFRDGRFSARSARRAAERLGKQLHGLEAGLWAIEPHKSGGYHQHWLLKFGEPEPHPSAVWGTAFQKYGRSHFDSMSRGGTEKVAYVAKYVGKLSGRGGTAENWDLILPRDTGSYRPNQKNLWR